MTWLLAFFALAALDLCWARYTAHVTANRPLASASWSVLLFLLSGASIIGYTRDPLLLIPSAAGAFCGTYIGVWWSGREQRRELREQIESMKTVLEAARAETVAAS